MPTSKAGLNSQAYSELQLAVANLQAQIDDLGGGVFRVIDFQSGQIAAGASGAILTKNIADVVGATAIRIGYLAGGSTTAEPNMQLTTVDGLSLSGTLCDTTPSATVTSTEFCVTPSFGSSTIINAARILNHVMCEGFTLTKTTGVTANVIDWAIEYGVVE